MKRTILLAAVAIVGVLAIGSLASGKTTAKAIKYSATMNVGQVTPRPHGTKVGASGRFTATLTGTTLRWTLTYAHLSGAATAAHIHMGTRGKNGIALVALCGPCKSPMSGTTNGVTDDVAALMGSGGAYVNVHTAKNEEGEIRGTVKTAH